MENNLQNKSILLIISGGIAAYKSLELIRLLKKSGVSKIRCILTKGGEQFVTPLSVSALCEEPVYTDLWSLKDETEMGHIRLSREADLIVIAPASANIIAQMAHGLAQDLATTALLAADKPVLIAPAMNHKMWDHPATRDNMQTLQSRGVKIVGPVEGDMACGEHGMGRMAEPEDILHSISEILRFRDSEIPRFRDDGKNTRPPHPLIPSSHNLKGRKALVTSGPTYEPIDPVRFIGNHSSGKQGHAIAQALTKAGAHVTLVTGPVSLPDPAGVNTIHVQTAAEMLAACETVLKTKTDIAICAAAVSDWSAAPQIQKIKKQPGQKPPALQLTENPDILKTIATHKNRPALVIGFAAETENLETNARAKLKTKACDWIIGNLVAQTHQKVFGEDQNHVYLINAAGTQDWQAMSKTAIAEKLTAAIIEHFDTPKIQTAAE